MGPRQSPRTRTKWVPSSVRSVKKAVGGRGTESAKDGERVGHGLMPPPQKIFDSRKIFYFFYFKIVHFGAFSYTNSKVLLPIKCRKRYVIMVFFAIDSDTDIKTSSFHQSRKPRPVSH